MLTEIPGSKSILQRVQLLLAYAKQGMVIKFQPLRRRLEMGARLKHSASLLKRQSRALQFDPEKRKASMTTV